MKTGNTPGYNFLPTVLFKLDPKWWAEPLAPQFTKIHQTGIIREGRKLALIIPFISKR